MAALSVVGRIRRKPPSGTAISPDGATLIRPTVGIVYERQRNKKGTLRCLF
ncbi:hypothetical protein HMPREF0208_04689 [Citrobacter koseri]|nr:hypothetical protein HMPREF3220_03893 [Citrobacter koseri]KXA02778.1 hypothetical protein HMPREF3207_02220 [Citrobacter koseri]KXB39678.1 hypothetical protein HMPREF0208_04689 [Citrobacter koseri]